MFFYLFSDIADFLYPYHCNFFVLCHEPFYSGFWSKRRKKGIKITCHKKVDSQEPNTYIWHLMEMTVVLLNKVIKIWPNSSNFELLNFRVLGQELWYFTVLCYFSQNLALKILEDNSFPWRQNIKTIKHLGKYSTKSEGSFLPYKEFKTFLSNLFAFPFPHIFFLSLRKEKKTLFCLSK